MVKIKYKIYKIKRKKNFDLRIFIYFNIILYFGIVEVEIFVFKVISSCDIDDLLKDEK